MSIEINLWLQDAIEFQLKEHVSRIVTERIPKDETVDAWFNVKIHDIEHSYGFITVSWSYQTNSRQPSTHQKGAELFTLAEALKTCMTDGAVSNCDELKIRDDKLKQSEDSWKVCIQDSYGNMQYECLKCHYVTKWVKDHSELATAKEHACPSPIDRAFDDLEI